MKSDKFKFLMCLLFFVVLAAITFRCTWPADHVFNASDLNIGRLAAKKNFLPESLTGYFTANQVMGASGASLTLFNLLLAIMPLTLFANTFYALVLIGGSISMVWFLRIWNRSWTASIFGALIAFWVNSIMLSAGGHAYKMEVLSLSVLSLCLIEKAIRSDSMRRSIGYAIMTGISIGIMMIEQQDVALLAGLFVGPYCLFRLIGVHGKSAKRYFALLAPLGVVALMLAGQTLFASYRINIAGAAAMQENNGTAGTGGDQKWDYITQWSMVPAEWPDLIASGWSGWSSNNPEGPYWGKIGQSAEWHDTGKGFRNFKLTSIYIGIIPFLLGLYGFGASIRDRKNDGARMVIFWSMASILGLLLAFGKYSLLYKLYYQLPLVSNIRAPMKFMDNFQICLGIVSAYGLDTLLLSLKQAKSTKILWLGGAILSGLLLLAGLKTVMFPGVWTAEFTRMGFQQYADVMLRNMSSAWFHAALLAFVCTLLAFLVWKGIGRKKWIGMTFVAVLAADSLVLTSHYFTAIDIAVLKKGSGLVNFLKENQGDERTFFMDQSGIYNQWLASDGPYHGLNLFNIWQMPRMPTEYKEYLEKVGRNQIRLWQLSAIKYVAAPATVLQQLQQNPEIGKEFKPILNYQVPTVRGMRPDVLLEFLNSIPRFSLYQNWEVLPVENHCEKLVAPSHDPIKTVLVADSSSMKNHAGNFSAKMIDVKLTKRNAVVHVESDEAAVLRFSQRYQPRWKVFVNGKPTELLRLDYICMGVKVPAGSNAITFQCVQNRMKAGYIGSVLFLSISFAVVLISKKAD